MSFGLDEVGFPVTIMEALVDTFGSEINGKSLISSDSGFARSPVVSAQMLAFPAVSEAMPKSAALVVVLPDEVVDALSGDPEIGIGHDDLIWAEVFFEGLDDELCEETTDLDAGEGASPVSLIFSILRFIVALGIGIALKLSGNRAGSTTEAGSNGTNRNSVVEHISNVSTV